MSSAHDDVVFEQPASFEFTPESMEHVNAVIAKYPQGREASGMLPLLYIAQKQHQNWVPRAAMDKIAELLGIPAIRVYEVATFYTMFHLTPVGKYHLQICTTTPCWLRGSDDVVATCRSKLGIDYGQITADGLFSMVEVECVGGCVNAPIIQVNDDFYEDLSGTLTEQLLDALARGDVPPMGPMIDRQLSAPVGGPTTLGTLQFKGDGNAA